MGGRQAYLAWFTEPVGDSVAVSLVVQDFETLIASGAYGGTRRLSASTELMLISLYMYESLYRWTNSNGAPLTDEQRDTVQLWAARAQDELMREVPTVPIGSVIAFAGKLIPDYALLCDGAAYNRVDYPELYNTLPNTMILNANAFLTPDLTDRFPRGTNTIASVNSPGGDDDFVLSVSNLPPHSHQVPFLQPSPVLFGEAPAGNFLRFNIAAPTFATQNTGSGAAKTHIPRYNTFRYIMIAR